MNILDSLRNLILRPRIANCPSCGCKDITVEVWEGEEDCFFACIYCEECGRERTTYSFDGEDDVVREIIFRWNDEASFWNYHAKRGKKHHRPWF